MTDKEKRPAEMEAPTGTVQIALPYLNMLDAEKQEKLKKLLEITALSCIVSGMEIHDRDGKPTMIYHFHGTCGGADFYYFSDGYYQDSFLERRYEEKRLYFDERGCFDFGEQYEEARSWLHGILEGMKHDA